MIGEHEQQIAKAKEEANISIRGLREANERLFEDQERLKDKYDALAKSKESELKN